MDKFSQFIENAQGIATTIGFSLCGFAVVATAIAAIIAGGRAGQEKVKERIITIGIAIAILSGGVSVISMFM